MQSSREKKIHKHKTVLNFAIVHTLHMRAAGIFSWLENECHLFCNMFHQASLKSIYFKLNLLTLGGRKVSQNIIYIYIYIFLKIILLVFCYLQNKVKIIIKYNVMCSV